LLEIAGITAGYQRLQVLWGIDLSVRARESVVLLGANGAGKTTLLKAIMNLIEIWEGRIGFDGEDITRLRTNERVRRGIVFMSESSGFPGLSIEENILIGAQFMPRERTRERMAELYATFPALAERRHARAGSLSGGQRKMLGIAKALAAEPRLLVMDEPSAGLSPLFVKEVIRILSDLRGRGLALLIAEQNIGFLEVATRVFVLEGGRIRFSGTVAEMTDNEALRRAYFGLK
jgi:branched-chain amino acid transport system ATP-binding protein